jgi:hypothetical protein
MALFLSGILTNRGGMATLEFCCICGYLVRVMSLPLSPNMTQSALVLLLVLLLYYIFLILLPFMGLIHTYLQHLSFLAPS